MTERTKRVDPERELEEHQGPTDPTGHISSGRQPGALKGEVGHPVSDVDETERELVEEI